jgi:hypothetical protein
MDVEQLRAVQAPLKAHYRVNPASAVITLRADGELGAEHVTCGSPRAQAGVRRLSRTDGLRVTIAARGARASRSW